MTRAVDLSSLLNSSGVLAPPSGQVAFPATQSASTDANTLDDYEEGTYTPTIADASFSTLTYLSQTGYYIKIGRLVYASFFIRTNVASGGSGNTSIGGLPFVSTSSTPTGQNMFTGYLGRNSANNSYNNLAFYSASSNVAFIYNAAGAVLQGSSIVNDTYLAGTIIYLTN